MHLFIRNMHIKIDGDRCSDGWECFLSRWNTITGRAGWNKSGATTGEDCTDFAGTPDSSRPKRRFRVQSHQHWGFGGDFQIISIFSHKTHTWRIGVDIVVYSQIGRCINEHTCVVAAAAETENGRWPRQRNTWSADMASTCRTDDSSHKVISALKHPPVGRSIVQPPPIDYAGMWTFGV